ncbi:hypothetical protein NL676_004561 [Syzygium grande]|nr:hypothetical protein NL676_004561 [Syzygium grande]
MPAPSRPLTPSLNSRTCREDQGAIAKAKVEGQSGEPVEGPQGRARPPPRRQGHRRCVEQTLQDGLLGIFNTDQQLSDLEYQNIQSFSTKICIQGRRSGSSR